jgi:lipopolysaccharide export system ATP-binding protein
MTEKKGLVATDLVKTYGERKVVDKLSLSVAPGEVVGILGPNGAGKTTAFYMMIGLIKPDAGTVTFNGKDVTHLPIHLRSRLGLGYLAQEPSVFKELSVEDNLLTVLEVIEPTIKAAHAKKTALLEEFGLAPFARRKAATLSGGERRRLEIARALATNPHCLMLDEPFANIDPIAIADVKAMLTLLKQKGISVLITDHNARELVMIVDRGYLIADGRVLRAGTTEELLADAQARARYFGEDFSL